VLITFSETASPALAVSKLSLVMLLTVEFEFCKTIVGPVPPIFV
jgi:hypothetical protein